MSRLPPLNFIVGEPDLYWNMQMERMAKEPSPMSKLPADRPQVQQEEPKITREQILMWMALGVSEFPSWQFDALCTLALQALDMEPRPIEELPDATWVLGWFVGNNAPEAAHMYSLIQQSADDSAMVWDGQIHRPKAWFTHFIPLTSLPEPRR